MEDEGNMFTAFLAEHRARMPAVVHVVARKRERFARLHHMLLKCVFLQRYEKGWHVATHMRRLLVDDEYPDEHIAGPLDAVLLYLDVVVAVCAYETQRDLGDCIRFCEDNIDACGILYPILYKTLAGCYLKIGCPEKAAAIVQTGLDFILTNFEEIETLQASQRDKQSLLVIRRLGDNSASHIFFVLYAFSSLLSMDVNDKVQSFVEGRSSPVDFKTLKALIQTHYECCYGSQLDQVLYQQMALMSMNAIHTMRKYYKRMDPLVCQFKHVPAHCSMQRVALNCNGLNDLIFVRRFDEVRQALSACPEGCCCYHAHAPGATAPTETLPAAKLGKCCRRRLKVAHIIAKPHRRRHSIVSSRCTAKMLVFFTRSLLPLLEQVIRHMRLDCEILILYHELLDDPQPVYRLFEGMESASMRILGLHRRCAMMMRGHTTVQARRILGKHMRLLCKRMVHWRNYIQVFVRHGVSKCIPKQRIQSANELLGVMRSDAASFYNSMRLALAEAPVAKSRLLSAIDEVTVKYSGVNNNVNFFNAPSSATAATRIAKGTQTNYSKFSCRSKQTQTDKYFPQEVNLWQQITELETSLAVQNAKDAELELRMQELKEAKWESTENYNRIVKTLKRDVGQARRTILEKNQEISQQKNQIEQLQMNLSKLNKSYSHVVKPPEDVPKVSTKSIIKENEKLQVLNVNMLVENEGLQKQLAALTEEFDNMKTNRDNLAVTNRELEMKLKEKSDQYDELYGMSCLNEKTAERLKEEEQRLILVKKMVRNSLKGFVDALIEKIAHYRVRCERIYEELTYFFYSCTPNMNIKQMCEANQMFLASMTRQLDRDMQFILVVKEDFADDRPDNIEILATNCNWKDLFIYMEEFCAAIFNQYVQSLNTLMTLHSALSHALMENARLINQTMTASQSALMEPDKFCRPHYHQPNYPKVTLQTLGAIGSNRPQHNAWSAYVRPHPTDIQDPKTKNILSQIGHAVNFASNLSLGYTRGAPPPPPPALDPSQGVVRRSPANHSASVENHHAMSANHRARVEPMKENCSTSSPSPDGADVFCNAKYREIFLAIKKRFPTALRNDLINALNFLGRMNTNMHKMSMESIFVNVANYIERQMQIRLKAAETTTEHAVECAKDELCSICFENISLMPTITLKCLHVFHEKCLKAWIRQNNICPICRKFTLLE